MTKSDWVEVEAFGQCNYFYSQAGKHQRCSELAVWTDSPGALPDSRAIDGLCQAHYERYVIGIEHA